VEFFLNCEMDFNQAQSRQTTGLVQADLSDTGRASTAHASPRLSAGRFPRLPIRE